MSHWQPPTTPRDFQVRRIEGVAHAVLDALLAANAVTMAAILDGPGAFADAETAAAPVLLLEHTERAQRATRLLARRIVLDEDQGELEEARQALEEMTASLADVAARKWSGRSAFRGRKRDVTQVNEGRISVASALREIGLADLDVSLHLGTDREGAEVIAWQPLPRESAAVYLLEGLYDRAEAAVLTDPLLDLERRASRWWFDRWSGRRKTPEEHFAWGVREQEWSLVDRVSIALEAPALSAFLDEDCGVATGERQRQLAEALVNSHTDVFRIAERHGSTTVLKGLVDDRRYELHEHNSGLSYRPGDIGAGRIIAIEPGRYLRSPGFVFLGDMPPETLVTVGRFLAGPAESPPPAVRIEMLLARLLRGEKIPRPLPPASSPSEAQECLTELRELLEEVDHAERMAPSDVSPELVAAARGMARVEYWTYEVDEVIRDWMSALIAQAKKLDAAPNRGGASKRKKGKKKRRR